MNQAPSVIVKKDGFFTAVARGFFGLLTTTVVCATGIGVYSLHVVDKKFGDIRSIGESVVSGMPRWRESLPPILADAINDRRAADYASNIDVKVRLVDGKRRDRQRAVIEVTNNGDETISLLSLNIRLEDADGVPVRTFTSYAATPLALNEGDWRGPILPQSKTRKFSCEIFVPEYDLTAVAEIADIRVAQPTAEPVAAPATARSERSHSLANRSD
jgi:hypothetical protein